MGRDREIYRWSYRQFNKESLELLNEKANSIASIKVSNIIYDRFKQFKKLNDLKNSAVFMRLTQTEKILL
jgi:hypothetical protein